MSKWKYFKHFSIAMICLLTICANAEDLADQHIGETQWRTTLVTASAHNKELQEVTGVSNHFTFNGKIYAHATLVAESNVKPVERIFTFKWFNGNRLIHQKSNLQNINGSPYYLTHAIPGTVLSTGFCRVELYSGSQLLASREFTVSEQ